MRIFIDFDKTITDEYGFDQEPNKEAKNAINKLFDSGHKIVIFSCRSNPYVCDPLDEKKMINYLQKHDVKFHEIVKNKPLFDMLIDDRSMNPHIQGWENILNMLGE